MATNRRLVKEIIKTRDRVAQNFNSNYWDRRTKSQRRLHSETLPQTAVTGLGSGLVRESLPSPECNLNYCKKEKD